MVVWEVSGQVKVGSVDELHGKVKLVNSVKNSSDHGGGEWKVLWIVHMYTKKSDMFLYFWGVW